MKKSFSNKIKYKLNLLLIAIILILGGFMLVKGYFSNKSLDAALQSEITKNNDSKGFSAKIIEKNNALVQELKALVSSDFIDRIEAQESKVALIKSFDSYFKNYFDFDSVTILNNLTISDISVDKPIKETSLILSFDTTQDSLLSIIEFLESSYMANPEADYFLSISGVSFNEVTEGVLNVDLKLKLYALNTELDLTKEDE